MMETIKKNKPLVITIALAVVIIAAVILVPKLTQREPSYNDLINAGMNGDLNALEEYARRLENENQNNNRGNDSTDVAACIASCETYIGSAGGVGLLSCESACRASADFESDDVSACNNQTGL